MSSIKKNAILNTLKTIIGILFPLITFPYVSRVLDVKQIGIYNFSNSIISYFSLIAALGVSTYAIREGTQYKNNREKMEKFISEVFTINVLSTLFSYILLFVCVFVFQTLKNNMYIILVMSIQIVFNTFGVNWICNIYEDFLYITIRTIAFQVISLCLLFLFVRDQNDLYNYVLISVFSVCSANIANWFYIKKKYISVKFKLTKKIKKHIKPIFTIFWTTLTMTLYVNSDITILGILMNDYAVGLYSSAVKIYTIIKNILVSIVIVLIPRFSLVFSEGKKEATDTLFNKVIDYMILLIFPMTIGLMLLSRDILFFLAGSKYTDAALSLAILSLATLFSMFAYIFINCILIPVQKESYVLRISVISAIMNIILNIIFVPIGGYVVAAITTVIAEAIMAIMAIQEGKKYVSVYGGRRSLMIVLEGCIVITIVCIVAKAIISNLLLRVICSITFSILGYICVLLVFKHPIAVEYYIKISDRNKII